MTKHVAKNLPLDNKTLNFFLKVVVHDFKVTQNIHFCGFFAKI